MRASSTRPHWTYYRCGVCGRSTKVLRRLPDDVEAGDREPSRDEIDQAASAIRAAWSEDERERRSVGHGPCELVVGHFLA